MSLHDWQKNGWIVEHLPAREEIADLRAVVERDLCDCMTTGLSADWRLNSAYNAALQAATAALAAEGFRATRDAHHHRVIQSLEFTLHLPPDTVTRFDRFRKKRNIAGYERTGTASEEEVKEMVNLAQQIHSVLADWLRSFHPELL